MGIGYNPKTVTNGLVACLDAGNLKSYPGSGTVWSDLSANGNTGSLVDGPTFDTNIFSFDGSNDRVHISSPSNKFAWTPSGSGLNALSIEMWFRTSETTGMLISKPWNGNGEYNYRFGPTSINLQIGAQTYTNSFTSLATGAWVHAVFVITATQVGVYKNGTVHFALAAHSITNNTPTSGNDNVQLCLMSLYPYGSGWAGSTTFSILGDVGLIKIYNRALGQEEINQNFQALRARFNI